MLREYYTTKPQALLLKIGRRVSAQGGIEWSGSARYQCAFSVGHERDTSVNTQSIKEDCLGDPAVGDGFQVCGIEW